MECSVSQLSYRSSNGTRDVQAYVYQQEHLEPKAVLQLSHGMCEYFLRYDHFARFLASHGYIVCGNDHIGHGNSIHMEQDLGFFAPRNGHQFLVQDVHQLTKIMQREFPSLPYFLLGHSMGSFIVRAYLERYSSDLNGAILSGTSGGNPLLGAGLAMAELLRRTRGEQHRSGFLRKLSGLSSSHYSDPFLPEFDWITRDRDMVKSYSEDPKCNFMFTVAGYQDLFTLLKTVSDKRWGEKIGKDLPIYLFSGADDPVGDYGKGVRKVANHLKKLGISDVTFKLYDHGRHEMLNEVNRTEVYQDTLNWLEEHIPLQER